jgi:hypothetical protein
VNPLRHYSRILPEGPDKRYIGGKDLLKQNRNPNYYAALLAT